jgi:hypothetical protein
VHKLEIKIDQLQSKIKDLETERSQLNPNLADDRFRLTQVDQQLADLRGQIAATEEEVLRNQIHEEVQEFVLGRDFNAVLGHPDANKIIYTLLYDERQHQIKDLRVKNEEIQLIQGELNGVKASLEAAKESLEEAAALTDDLNQLKAENELLMNETRLEGKLRDTQNVLELERKKADAFAPRSNDSLDKMLEEATNTTKQRRKITNVQAVDLKKSAYTATDEEGQSLTIPWFDLGKYEQVDHLPAPPSGDKVEEEVTERQLDAAEREVAAAADDAQRFQSVVQSDSATDEAERGAGEAVGASDAVPETNTPEETLNARVEALEVWKKQVSDVLYNRLSEIV